MLNNITWQGYWTTLALLSAGYYLVVYLLYFRNDFTISVSKGGGRKWTPVSDSGSSQPSLFDGAQTTTPVSDNLSDVDQLVHACTDELSAYFQEASRSKGAKEEMLIALSKILSKYPTIRSSEYAASLKNLIRSEAEHHCSIHLSSEEVVQVWLAA